MSIETMDESADLKSELERAWARIASLEALLRTGELLDSSLDFARLVHRALELSLRVVPADAALLVLADGRRDTAHYLLRGESFLRTHPGIPSGLAREVLESGDQGVRRETESPGSRAAAEVIGAVPEYRVAVPLKRGRRVLGVLEAVYRKMPTPRDDEDSIGLTSVADHLAIALDNATLVRDLSQRAREQAHLHEIGTKINSHQRLPALLDEIVDSFLELVTADAAGIFLIDRDTREIRHQTLRGYDSSRLEEVRLKVGAGILGWVANTGEAINVPNVRLDHRYVEARETTVSEMAAPLIYDGRVIGVFNLESDQASAYRSRDLELLRMFSNQVATSIMHAHLHEEAKQKRVLEEQLRVARTIQKSLLPEGSPEVPGHVLAGKNIPSAAVGGDYFDFLRLDEERWAILIADVSGSGIPAGLIMAGFRAELRAAVKRNDKPADVFSELNPVLFEELDSDHFVTAFLGVYEPASGRLSYSSAGHEPALLVRRSGPVEELSEGGLLLGVFQEAEYDSDVVTLEPGEQLLLYTDGLSDAADPWGGLLETEGILRIHRDALRDDVDPRDLPAEILQRAEAEAAVPPEEADDRTLVVLSRLADSGI